MATPLEALEAAEAALGANLTWITDLADLRVRQKAPDTLARLTTLNAAWENLVRTIADLRKVTE